MQTVPVVTLRNQWSAIATTTREMLEDARRKIYQILGEEDETTESISSGLRIP